MSREHDTVIMVTASLLTGNGRSARLLYLLTFSSPRQVGGWEPGSSQEVTLPLIPDEDMEINQHEHLYPVWKDFVWSQSVSGVQSKSHKDTGDDTKLVSENGRPSMYVYHTMPMVRTLSSCWQVLYKTKWEKHGDSKFFFWIFHFYEKSLSLGKKLSNKSFTRV